MKRAEYVAAVTSVYSHAAAGNDVTRPMMEQLYNAFNRQGFTDGYYQGRIGEPMFGTRQEEQENKAFYKAMRQTYEATETPRVPVTMEMEVTSSGSRLSVQDPEGRICETLGPVPAEAVSLPLTEDALADRLLKTGGTPYICTQVRVRVAPGLMLPVSAINAMRRDVLNMLTAKRGRLEPVSLGKPRKFMIYPGQRRAPALTVQVTAREQITLSLLKMRPDILYVPLHILTEDADLCRNLVRYVKVCAVLPRIVHDGDIPRVIQDMRLVRSLGVEEALVGNLGLMIPAREAGMDIRGDFGLNLYNSGAVNAVRELELRSACLSFEMTLPQIRDVSKGIPCEILSYGRLPLMVTENCLIRGKTGKCTCHLAPTKLTDKTGADFPIIRDGNSCRSVVLNGKKLNWLDRQDELGRLGLWATRIYFTTENPKEVDQVMASFLNPKPFDPGACTRGLYLRGVE